MRTEARLLENLQCRVGPPRESEFFHTTVRVINEKEPLVAALRGQGQTRAVLSSWLLPPARTAVSTNFRDCKRET